jgi:hypothetical protein
MHGTAERRRDRLGIGTSGAGADSDVRGDEQRTDADARVRDRGGDRPAAREDSRPVCRAHRSFPAGMSEVIALPAGTRIWLAAGVTDMRCYAELLVMRSWPAVHGAVWAVGLMTLRITG